MHLKKIENSGIFISTLLNSSSLGWFVIYVNNDIPDDEYDSKFLRNNLLGYIPIIGILVGISRLQNIYYLKDTSKTNYAIAIIRGISEVLGIGLLMLIFDIIVSVIRYNNFKYIKIS